MKNNNTDKVEQSSFALSLKSANDSQFPVVYGDDVWDVAKDGSKLKDVMGAKGNASQSEINEKVSEKVLSANSSANSAITTANSALAAAQQASGSATAASNSATAASNSLTTIRTEIAQMQAAADTDAAIVAKVALNTTDIGGAKSDISEIAAALEKVESTTTKMVLEQGTISGANDQDGVQASRVRTKGHFVASATTIKLKVKGKNGVNAVVAQAVFSKPDGTYNFNMAQQTAEVTYTNIVVGTKVRLVLKNADAADATQTASNYEILLSECTGVTAEDGATESTTTTSYKKVMSADDFDEDTISDIQNAIGFSEYDDILPNLELGSMNGTTMENSASAQRVRTTGVMKATADTIRVRVSGKNGVNAVVAQVVWKKTNNNVYYDLSKQTNDAKFNVGTGSLVRIVFKDADAPNANQSASNYVLRLSNCEELVMNDSEYATKHVKELNKMEEKKSYGVIYPKNVYLVCNDSAAGSAYNRNISPAIYADHIIKDVMEEEKDIRFADGGVMQALSFRAEANAGWSATLNKGLAVDKFVKKFKLHGDCQTIAFNTNIISTKATSSVPNVRLLVIGSSTAYGEGATYLSNGMTGVKPYHAICYELIKKDAIEQNNGGKLVNLGIVKNGGLSFSFNGQTYTYDNYHEGYRGCSINQFIGAAASNNLPDFLDANGEFSFKEGWLKKYRTMDDAGVRLTAPASGAVAGASVTGSDGKSYVIGSQVNNSAALSQYNVCEPTHIIFHIGSNGGATIEQLNTLVNKARTEFPNAYIGLVMNDVMGTIFPSAYRDANSSKCRWNSLDLFNDDRRATNLAIQELYANFDSESWMSNKVYVLPFFFVANPCAMASRVSNLPEYDVDKTAVHDEAWGWLPSTHADIRAHYAYGYQLYSWIKYTLTL